MEWARGKSIYKMSKKYKEILGKTKKLNKIIQSGTSKQKKKAMKDKFDMLEAESIDRDVCIVRTVKKKWPVRYTYITTSSDIQDNDICAIYRIKGGKSE